MKVKITSKESGHRVGEVFEVADYTDGLYKSRSSVIKKAHCERIDTEYEPITYEGKTYTQLKEITGEAIYNAQPDKENKTFREDLKNWIIREGFFGEVILYGGLINDYIQFYPTWLPFLEQHGFIRIENEEIQVGDIVAVVDNGRGYSSYKKLADKLGAKRFRSTLSFTINNGQRGRVVAMGQHLQEEKTVALVDIISEEILIDIRGLKKV